MNGFVAILRELGPVITAATPVLLIIVNWWVTKRQTQQINQHSTDTTDSVISAVVSASGSYKALKPPDGKG